MPYRTWIYHATEQAKIIDKKDFKKYEKEGWRDSPATFLKVEGVGISQKKIDDGDSNELMKAQQVTSAISTTKDHLNDMLNLKKMTKRELGETAFRLFGVNLDEQVKKAELIKQIEALNGAKDGDSE